MDDTKQLASVRLSSGSFVSVCHGLKKTEPVRTFQREWELLRGVREC